MNSNMKIGPGFNGIMNGYYATGHRLKREIFQKTSTSQDGLAREIAQAISPVRNLVRENFVIDINEKDLINFINKIIKNDVGKKIPPQIDTISEFTQSPEGFFMKGFSSEDNKIQVTLGYSYTEKPMVLD